MADLVTKKKMIKSNTKIIIPEDKEKERSSKLVQKENENHLEGNGNN